MTRVVVVIDLGPCDAEKVAEIEADFERMNAAIPDRTKQSMTLLRDKAASRVMQAVRAPW